MKGADLDLSAVRAFWTERKPSLLALLDAMEKREHWPPKEVPDSLGPLLGESFDLLEKVEQARSDKDPFVRDCVRQLTENLAALASATATYILMQADMNYGQVAFQLLRDSHDGQMESPECNVMWQRAMMLARYNLLRELAKDISEGVV